MSKLFTKPIMGENVNTLGLFDLIKGFMIFTIIWDHTFWAFGGDFGNIGGTSFNYFHILKGFIGLGEATVPLFMVISGYGFRPGKISKVLKTQFNTLLKPYIYVAVISPACFIIVHYLNFRNLSASIREAFSMIGGYALCSSVTISIGKYIFFSPGAVWFLLGLFVAWNLLNIMYNYIPEKYIKYIVIICYIVGQTFSYLGITIWSIDRTLNLLIFLYLGYVIKKRDILFLDFSVGYKVLAGVIYVLGAIGYVFFRGPGGVTGAMVIYSMFAVPFIMLFVAKWFDKFEFPMREYITRAGRYSLWVMCAEGFTLNVFPWYRVKAFTNENEYVAFLIIITCKIIIIYSIYRLLLFIEKKNSQKKRALRAARKKADIKENA